MTYAREAVNQDDLALTREWASLIQDGNVVRRVEAVIEKATKGADN